MRRVWTLTFLASAAVSLACPPTTPAEQACLDACVVAARCGALPSTLGGAADDNLAALVDRCVDRCVRSELDEHVDSVLACLTPHAGDDVCDMHACMSALDCLRTETYEATLGAPKVSFRLIEGAHWLALFHPHLCNELPADYEEGDFLAACAVEGDPCPEAPDEDEGATARLRPALCTPAACDAADGMPEAYCDPRLCDLDPTPSLDCELFGIEVVQFGYIDEHDVFHLDPNTYTCADAVRGVTVDGPINEPIYPLALFHGTVSPRLTDMLGVPSDAAGREYCWLSYPHDFLDPLAIGWLPRAGDNLVVVPTPDAAELLADLRDEPGIFPTGCTCVIGDSECEQANNLNCENDYDDDHDSLTDEEDPGCLDDGS